MSAEPESAYQVENASTPLPLAETATGGRATNPENKANGGLGMWLGETPIGVNRVSVHEERFPLGGTYQIAPQLDGLGHVGVGNRFYGGYTARRSSPTRRPR